MIVVEKDYEQALWNFYQEHQIAVAWQNTCSVVGCQQKCRSGWGLRIHSWDQHRPLLLSLRAGFSRCRDRE